MNPVASVHVPQMPQMPRSFTPCACHRAMPLLPHLLGLSSLPAPLALRWLPRRRPPCARRVWMGVTLPAPRALVPHSREHTLFLLLQGEVAHTTEGFSSFPKGSPPPDNPKLKGGPAEGRLLQTPRVQTKRCWDPGKLENLIPRGRDGAWLPGVRGVLQMLERVAPADPSGGCVDGVAKRTLGTCWRGWESFLVLSWKRE